MSTAQTNPPPPPAPLSTGAGAPPTSADSHPPGDPETPLTAGSIGDDLSNVTPQELAKAEKTLQELLSRKKQVDRSLIELEKRIYNIETGYLEDTSQGNIIRGFEGYLTNTGLGNRKKQKLVEEDRLFSRSSVTYPKALEIASHTRHDDDDSSHRHHSTSTAAQASSSTYRGTPTPLSQVDRLKKAAQKRRKSSLSAEPVDATPVARKKRRGGEEENE
ncbi:histone acetyltransferase subunit NuA4-domain-containing protein [Fimicolochytrium jonesii]|uniref:histone acetyltransferase subunit NuA4-domain-containing protein n=1 Tax=Fimicolochytrium jonesii TaxID=1396493 RepID=UPI0022FE738F|nr:histone acetyltransferase subunit NuA4-domain-containing protein [Fimicolochytrium jonesii]KAI8821692.1 histone acetyltransferase subunit NuA4-domain-containing protein [Fimicolochytrium jonesii]